jgi:hypothetical protein
MLPLSKKRKPVYRNFATKYFFGWRQMRIALIINIHASALTGAAILLDMIPGIGEKRQPE